MAQRGKPSEAHEYDENGVCIYCSMYKSNVERMSHVCKPWRELEVDQAEAEKQGEDLGSYRRGGE